MKDPLDGNHDIGNSPEDFRDYVRSSNFNNECPFSVKAKSMMNVLNL